MTEQLISLRLIADNPYQPRTVDDPEHIEKLARSIAADGLLQKPTGRHFGNNGAGIKQLAFGHSRRKAFEWLRDNWKAEKLTDRYNGYTVMPIDVVELSDEEMYRQAVSENVQRKDLNPIELAQAMVKYRDDFKKSSDEVGELFGISGATVRGLVRLLELPEPVKDKVASGEITQGAARKLLTIARVDESQVKRAAENITTGMSADEAVNTAMHESDSAFIMWFGWRDSAPLAGEHLWRIDTPPEKFPMQYLPKLTATEAEKILDIQDTTPGKIKLGGWIGAFEEQPTKLGGGHWLNFNGNHKIEGDVAEFLIAHGAPADQVEKLAHLIAPPACSTCPFHSVLDKQHYCGLKPCHQRKRKAWVEAEIQKLSKKLGIAIYDKATDGGAFLPLSEHSYQDSYQAHAKLVKAKDADLRLQPHKDEYNKHKFTESHFVRVVLVGKKAQAVKEKKQDAAGKERAQAEARERARELERARGEASRKFYIEQVPALFAPAFKKLDHIAALCALTNVGNPKKGAKKSAVLADLHLRLADRAVHDDIADWTTREKGPVAVAKKAQKVAMTWGVKVPTNWLETAQGYEPSVSVETGKKK